MIKEDVLRNLVKFENRHFPVTSAYFTVNSISGDRKSHLIELKKMFRYKKTKTYFQQLSESEQKSVLADFEQILTWFTKGFDSSKYMSSICFSSSTTGLWRTFDLKRPLKNELAILPSPYVRPLTTLFSTHRNYAVVLIDRAKARILESRLGEFLDHFYVEDNTPEGIKVGGFQGTEERRVERNLHQAVVQHYKQIAQKLFDLHKSYNFNWIIIGGRKEAITEFQKHLHDYVASKVQAVVEVEPAAPLNEVLKLVRQTEQAARAKFEAQLHDELMTKLQVNQAVEGIEGVLHAARKNMVHTLLIHEDFKAKGVFSRNCDYLGLKPLDNCPECGNPLERTSDIVEHLLHLTLNQKANVEYLDGSLKQHGDIAAILHYPMVA
jgi:peptide subunit release factor 1 (eRF1)